MLEETRPDGNGRVRGLLSSRVSARRVESRVFTPGDAVRAVVQYHWIASWDLVGQPPHEVELLGDPCVHLVIQSGSSRVVGVNTRLWRGARAGTGLIRAMKLRAGAAGAVLGAIPVGRLTDRVVPFEDVFPGEQPGIEAAVLGPKRHVEGLAAFESWLAGRAALPLDARSAEITTIVERVARDPTLTTVARVAARSGMDVRTLQRRFREQVGATPKWVIRRYRLQEAAVRLERGEVSLAALAAELGYADQAHLSRDFKAVVGRSPREFARTVWT